MLNTALPGIPCREATGSTATYTGVRSFPASGNTRNHGAAMGSCAVFQVSGAPLGDCSSIARSSCPAARPDRVTDSGATNWGDTLPGSGSRSSSMPSASASGGARLVSKSANVSATTWPVSNNCACRGWPSCPSHMTLLPAPTQNLPPLAASAPMGAGKVRDQSAPAPVQRVSSAPFATNTPSNGVPVGVERASGGKSGTICSADFSQWPGAVSVAFTKHHCEIYPKRVSSDRDTHHKVVGPLKARACAWSHSVPRASSWATGAPSAESAGTIQTVVCSGSPGAVVVQAAATATMRPSASPAMPMRRGGVGVGAKSATSWAGASTSPSIDKRSPAFVDCTMAVFPGPKAMRPTSGSASSRRMASRA